MMMLKGKGGRQGGGETGCRQSDALRIGILLSIHACINDALYYSDVPNVIASQIMKTFMHDIIQHYSQLRNEK